MTAEQFLDNSFFAYFFTTGEYIIPLFALMMVACIVGSLIKFFWNT